MGLNPRQPAYEARRLSELARALVLQQRQKAREGWSRAEIEALQQRRLDDAVRHAASKSAFYRELYRGVALDGPIDLSRLPVVTRDELMGRFDDWVTDPQLTLSGLEGHLQTFAGPDGYYLGRYRVLTTSGSSGRRGVFVFASREWLLPPAPAPRLPGRARVRRHA